MPELPEVETVRRTVGPYLANRRVLAVEVVETRMRTPVPVALLQRVMTGSTIRAVRRRGKYLLFDVAPAAGATSLGLQSDDAAGYVMLVHLGMSGKLRCVEAGAPRLKHDHVIWHMEGNREVRYHDPRRFGLVEVFARSQEASHLRLVNLGVEPLESAAFHPQMLYAATRGVNKPIKNFIMDANQVVGVGNIYACESLFASGIHPTRPAGTLTRRRCEALVTAIVSTLNEAIAVGGTTLRDFADAAGAQGYFTIRLQVYGREDEPCLKCGRTIRRVVQAGRSTFYCPGCQH